MPQFLQSESFRECGRRNLSSPICVIVLFQNVYSFAFIGFIASRLYRVHEGFLYFIKQHQSEDEEDEGAEQTVSEP